MIAIHAGRRQDGGQIFRLAALQNDSRLFHARFDGKLGSGGPFGPAAVIPGDILVTEQPAKDEPGLTCLVARSAMNDEAGVPVADKLFIRFREIGQWFEAHSDRSGGEI